MTTEELIRDVQHHHDLCREALAFFSSPDSGSAGDLALRKTLPARLDMSLTSLRRWRHWWRQISVEERQAHPEVARLLQETLDLMMKSIVLGRETCERKATAPSRPSVAPQERVSAAPAFTQAEPLPKSAHFVARRYSCHAD